MKKTLVVIGLVALMALMGSAAMAATSGTGSITYEVDNISALTLTTTGGLGFHATAATAGTGINDVTNNWTYAVTANRMDADDTKTIFGKISATSPESFPTGLTWTGNATAPTDSGGTTAGAAVALTAVDAALVTGITTVNQPSTAFALTMHTTVAVPKTTSSTGLFTMTITDVPSL